MNSFVVILFEIKVWLIFFNKKCFLRSNIVFG
jgi:hypothetical protein